MIPSTINNNFHKKQTYNKKTVISYINFLSPDLQDRNLIVNMFNTHFILTGSYPILKNISFKSNSNTTLAPTSFSKKIKHKATRMIIYSILHSYSHIYDFNNNLFINILKKFENDSFFKWEFNTKLCLIEKRKILKISTKNFNIFSLDLDSKEDTLLLNNMLVNKKSNIFSFYLTFNNNKKLKKIYEKA